ncbi:hypothetical protein [Flavobacterium faecale]|uniref:hypothetical protein n=1 Tax=Flavobacterium faecale TaxID=1355330 RepID=UPI003AAC5D5C
MSNLEIKNNLNEVFLKLIQETNPDLFNKYRRDFLDVISEIKLSDTSALESQIDIFNLTCDEYVNKGFNQDAKQLLFGDFEMFLITLCED